MCQKTYETVQCLSYTYTNHRVGINLHYQTIVYLKPAQASDVNKLSYTALICAITEKIASLNFFARI